MWVVTIIVIDIKSYVQTFNNYNINIKLREKSFFFFKLIAINYFDNYNKKNTKTQLHN